jgi:branched-chain amino acid transport system ATP-binding protein
MTTMTLRASRVSVDFSGLRVLDAVTLDVAPGEIVGLIGPNGSGKTTLVNVITGQIKPAAGAVFLGDEAITGLHPRVIALRGIARTFQIVRLFRDLTVEENVEVAALAQGLTRRAARRRAAALLVEFGLAALARLSAGTLSYGDERRVEIARALAGDPRFVLLDEPAAGMNEAESAALLEILRALPQARGLGMLVIDHDVPLITRLCDRLHVLASGRTIGEGDVDTVRRLPAVIEAYLGTRGEAPAEHA